MLSLPIAPNFSDWSWVPTRSNSRESPWKSRAMPTPISISNPISKESRQLAARVSSRFRPDANVRDIIGQINWVLYVEEGFGGNREEYYDPRNSYLNEVLDRKLGIPISLSVVYWTVAEHLGLSMAGVNLPAHFMLRVDENERTWFVDPFHAGAIYNRRRCEQRLSEIAQQPVVLTDLLTAPCSISVVVGADAQEPQSDLLECSRRCVHSSHPATACRSQPE